MFREGKNLFEFCLNEGLSSEWSTAWQMFVSLNLCFAQDDRKNAFEKPYSLLAKLLREIGLQVATPGGEAGPAFVLP
jgi:hypothetical protein